jgi:hypothetical protein
MQESPESGNRFSFRADTRVYVIVSIFCVFFVILGTSITLKQPNQWPVLAVALAVLGAFFVGLNFLRFEVGPDYFFYRNLSGSRKLPFTDISRTGFGAIYVSGTPAPGASFWIEPKRGKSFKVKLRTFPIEAAARLFSALDRAGIPIDVPDVWGCQRMASQIRDCQHKIEEK